MSFLNGKTRLIRLTGIINLICWICYMIIAYCLVMRFLKEVISLEGEYKKHKEFFNEQAKQVIEFCEQNNKAYHIKNGTIME